MSPTSRDRRPRQSRRTTLAARLVEEADRSLLDLIDNALNRGITIHGELILGLADVDLIYLRISALVAAADRVGREGMRDS